MIDITDFRYRYPEFSDTILYPNGRIQLFIDDAVLWMDSEPKWLDYYNLAQNALVAHFLSISDLSETGDSGAVYPIKKQEVDDVIIEQAVDKVSPKIDLLYTTIYGQQYAKYRDMLFSGPIGV